MRPLTIDWLERAHLAIDLGGIAQAFHANINVGAGFGGNHVGAGASANDADVQGQSSLRFPKRCDHVPRASKLLKTARPHISGLPPPLIVAKF